VITYQKHFLLMKRVAKGDIKSEAGGRKVSNWYSAQGSAAKLPAGP